MEEFGVDFGVVLNLLIELVGFLINFFVFGLFLGLRHIYHGVLQDLPGLYLVLILTGVDQLVVVSLVHLLDRPLLSDLDFAPNLGNIKHGQVLFDNTDHLGIGVADFIPILFANGVAVDVGQSSVDECRSLIEGHFEGSDHALVRVLDAVNLLFVDFVANYHGSSRDKDQLVEFFKLAHNDSMLLLEPGFQECQDHEHEIAVDLILPVVKVVELLRVVDFKFGLLGDSEEYLELVQEVVEQKSTVQLVLYLLR